MAAESAGRGGLGFCSGVVNFGRGGSLKLASISFIKLGTSAPVVVTLPVSPTTPLPKSFPIKLGISAPAVLATLPVFPATPLPKSFFIKLGISAPAVLVTLSAFAASPLPESFFIKLGISALAVFETPSLPMPGPCTATAFSLPLDSVERSICWLSSTVERRRL